MYRLAHRLARPHRRRARKEVPDTDVHVYGATEANRVKDSMAGKPGVANSVLPHTTVDLISYSSWDTQDSEESLGKAVDYLRVAVTADGGVRTKHTQRLSRGIWRAGKRPRDRRRQHEHQQRDFRREIARHSIRGVLGDLLATRISRRQRRRLRTMRMCSDSG